MAYNKKLKEFVEKIKVKQDRTNPVVDHARPSVPDIEFPDEDDFDGKIPEDHFYADYSEEDLLDILNEQQKVVEFLKQHNKSKHLANRILFIFDDMVGSNLFSNNRQNAFKMLNTNHRHKSASLIMVSQAFKEIPKTIRTQFSALIAFEILSEAEIKALYEEFPMGLKFNDWLQVYNYCVSGDFNFLYYNMQIKEKRLRIMKCFDEHVFIENAPAQENTKKRQLEVDASLSQSSESQAESQRASKRQK